MWYGDTFGWGMGLMMLFMMLIWGGIVALVVWFIVRATRHESSAGERHTPLEIARERYARGEITKEEFDRIRKDL